MSKLSKQDYQEIRTIVEDVVEEKLEEKLDQKLDEKFKGLPTKEEFYGRTDKILKELENMRGENMVGAHQISDHEERITALENVSPQSKPT